MGKWIDSEKLLEDLKGYDLEETREYQIVKREIENAPVVARTLKEWWRLRMDVQGRRIDMRFKDRPISKEKFIAFCRFIIACILLYFALGAMGLSRIIYFWLH